MTPKQCYHRLELSHEATAIEIRQAYKRLVKKWHPDKFQAGSPMCAYAEERIKIINAAYDFLCKHPYSAKTQPESKSENSSIRPSKKFTFSSDFLQKTVFVKRQSFTSLINLLFSLKDLFYSTTSNHVHTYQAGKAGNQTFQKDLKQNLRQFKANKLKPGDNHKKKHDGFKTIYNLRKHYGPRHKKNNGSITGAASLNKTQTINAVRRVAPIRPIK